MSDHERPLNDRGRRDAPRMGRLLRNEGLVPDLIISSTAVRAWRTAEAAAETAGYENELLTTRQLYHAGPEEIAAVARGVPDEVKRLLLVGHNPGMSEMVDWVTGLPEALPTAALAQLSLPIQRWAEFDEECAGTLENLWLPRYLSD